MPVDIETMRSEISIQPVANTSEYNVSGPASAIDQDQLREIIRELVMEIVGDDIYSLFRMRGM